MLYDGPQLAMTYLSAFQLTGAQGYGRVARGILDYLRRDMTHPEGGVFSAEVGADMKHPKTEPLSDNRWGMQTCRMTD